MSTPPLAGAPAAVNALPALHPGSWQPHALQGPDALWQERNCYIDLWLALLQGLQLQPLALWPHALVLDFEGDQFTFFKPPHAELRRLYGIDVQELTVWRPLAAHLLEHLGAGRLVACEVDAWWLPDVAGTDYHHAHSKTTIVVTALDLGARQMTYLHNAGCFTLGGEDLDGLLAPPAGGLPLFAEFIRLDRLRQREAPVLRAMARQHLAAHLDFRPATNPVQALARRLQDELPALREAGLDHYHRWAFGSIRQLGAAAELAAAGLRWQAEGEADTLAAEHWRAAAEAGQALAATAKTLILKGARAVASPRPTDLGPLLASAAQDWQRMMDAVDAAVTADTRPG